MCRSCSEGGRRCRRTDGTRAAERSASKRYYARAKARKKIAALREQGIPAMDDLDCPVTYHLGDELDLTKPLPRDSAGTKKPPGLWTSPGRVAADDTVQTAWMDWHIIDGARREVAEGRTLFTVTPQPGAVVVRLDDAESVKAFGRAFPQFATNRGRDYDQQEAWAAVRATGVDGIMLTKGGLIGHREVLMEGDSADYQQRRSTKEGAFAETLQLWDASSVVWFNNSAIRSPGTVTPGPYEETDIPDGDDPYGYDRFRLPSDTTLNEGQRTTKDPKGAVVARGA